MGEPDPCVLAVDASSGRGMSKTDTSFWQQQASRYDAVTLRLNPSLPHLAGELAKQITETCEVLEVAAGTGLLTEHLAHRSGRYLATDREPAMLELLSGRVGARQLEVQVADATSLPFANESFDIVVMANLLHLLPEPDAGLTEAARVLRPGGLLLAPTFCHGADRLARLISQTLGVVGFPIATRFVGPDLDELIAAHGFSVESARTVPGLLPMRSVIARRPAPLAQGQVA